MAIKLKLSTDLNLKQLTHLKTHPRADAGLQTQYFGLVKLASGSEEGKTCAVSLSPGREAIAQYPAYHKLKKKWNSTSVAKLNHESTCCLGAWRLSESLWPCTESVP